MLPAITLHFLLLTMRCLDPREDGQLVHGLPQTRIWQRQGCKNPCSDIPWPLTASTGSSSHGQAEVLLQQ